MQKNPYNKKHNSLYAKIHPQGGWVSVEFGSDIIGGGDENNIKINQVAMILYGSKIWISSGDRDSVCARNKNSHDLGYRLFDSENVYN